MNSYIVLLIPLNFSQFQMLFIIFSNTLSKWKCLEAWVKSFSKSTKINIFVLSDHFKRNQRKVKILDSPRRRNYRINVKARCAKLFWRTNYVWKLARSVKGRAKRNLRCEKVAKTTVGIKDRSGEGIINSIEMRARASLSWRRQLEEETLLAASTDIRISEYRAATRHANPHGFSWLYSSIPPINEVFHRCKGRPRGYCLLDIWNPISTIATFSFPPPQFRRCAF